MLQMLDNIFSYAIFFQVLFVT